MKKLVVQSHFVKKHPSGIIQLIINTIDRWVDFHAYNDFEFEIDGEKFSAEDPLLQNLSMFVQTVQQNKDQIVFYYIPFELVTNKPTLKVV